MRVLSASATAYRRQLLAGYVTHERAAVRAVATAAKGVRETVARLAPTTLTDLQPTLRAITPHLQREATALRATMRTAYRDVAQVTLGFQSRVAKYQLETARGVAVLLRRAQQAVVAEHTVGGRITLLAGAQKRAVSTRLLLGIRRGESPEQLVAAIEKLYRGALDGSGGAAYAARRLVQSELTRFHGAVAEQAAYDLRKQTGRVTIFVYRTQGDDLVRDTHDDLDGEEFAEDTVADAADVRPLSEAQDALSDPNCRCWLDVETVLDAGD